MHSLHNKQTIETMKKEYENVSKRDIGGSQVQQQLVAVKNM